VGRIICWEFPSGYGVLQLLSRDGDGGPRGNGSPDCPAITGDGNAACVRIKRSPLITMGFKRKLITN